MRDSRYFEITPRVKAFLSERYDLIGDAYRTVSFDDVPESERRYCDPGTEFGLLSDEAYDDLKRSYDLFLSEETAEKRMKSVDDMLISEITKFINGDAAIAEKFRLKFGTDIFGKTSLFKL